MIFSYLSVGIIRLITIGSQFLLISLISRLIGLDATGEYAKFFSILSIAATISIFGQVAGSYRNIPGLLKNNNYMAAATDAFACLRTGILSCLTITIILVTIYYNFLSSDLQLAAMFSIMVLLFGLLQISSAISRSYKGIIQSEFFKNTFWRLVLIALIIFWPADKLTIKFVFLFMSVAIFCALIFSLIGLKRLIGAKSSFRFEGTVNAKLIDFQSWGISVMQVLAQQIDIVLVGILFDPTTTGIYFVLTRISSVIAMPLSISNPVVTPFIARNAKGDFSDSVISRISTNSLINIVTVTFISLVVLVYQDALYLVITNEDVYHYSSIFIILVAGQVVNGLAGPTVIASQLYDIKSTVIRLQVIILFMNIILMIVLGQMYGLIAVAIIVSASKALIHGIIIYRIYRAHGTLLLNGKNYINT